jgi:hypothetical protein
MQNFFANVWKNLRLAVTLTAVLFLAVSGLQVVAQSDTGRITGTVSDTTGAAIPGATITVTNTGTNATQTVSSDGIGDFTVSALPTGNYHIAVAKTGFATQEQNLRLDVAQVQTENFKLAAGATSTVVDVTDAAPVVDLATSDTSEVITGRELADLPLNGRNFTQLALLQPGVSRGQSNSQASGYQKGNQPVETIRFAETGGAAVSANGLRPQANNFILDGIDNNDSLVNTIVVFPNVEALSEFRITNSLAPAEIGAPVAPSSRPRSRAAPTKSTARPLSSTVTRPSAQPARTTSRPRSRRKTSIATSMAARSARPSGRTTSSSSATTPACASHCRTAASRSTPCLP